MGSLHRGDEITLPAGSEVRGLRALLPSGAGYVCAARLPRDGALPGKAADLRVLPVAFDASGERKRLFSEAAALLSEEEIVRSLYGSVVREVLPRQRRVLPAVFRAVEACSQCERVRPCMLRNGSHQQIARQSANHRPVKPSFVGWRRNPVPKWQLIREAYKVSPNAPDFSAADEFMGWGSRRHGGALAPALGRYVSEELRAQASVAKEARKAKEEKDLRAAAKKVSGKDAEKK
eukprot:6057943-Amphidinium_carterae.2